MGGGVNQERLELDLGPSVVERLTAHRRPFLFVDRIVGYRHGPRPKLWAERYISAGDRVFDGHFPGFSVWPGVLTIEGMGQSSGLLAAVAGLSSAIVSQGGDPRVLFDGLAQVELRASLRPFDARRIQAMEAVLSELAIEPRLGLGVSVDVKLSAPVFAGQVLRYEVERTHDLGEIARFDVSANVAGREVARGTMTGCFRKLSPETASETRA